MSPRENRSLGVFPALLAMVVLVALAVLTARCDRQAAEASSSFVGGDQSAASGGPVDTGLRPTLVRGIAQRELPVESEGQGTRSDPAQQDDAELAAIVAELAPWTLEPPVAGSCHVRAWQEGQAVAEEVECDEQGRFELEIDGEIIGEIEVELSIEGHLRGVVPVELGMGEGGIVEMPTVALGPGHRIAGQTVDARGQPIAGARVQALPRPTLGETIPWRTRSDEEGRFEFTTLPYGPVNLRAIKEGYALSVVEALAPEDRVLMVLDELIDLEGQVVADASLIERATVRLEGSSVWPAVEAGLAEDGSFEFENLPDGIYGVEVTVPASEPGGQEYASVPLENVTPDLRVSLALIPAFRVPVRVVDPEGEPVPRARVTLGYGQLGMLQKVGETDAEGRVRVGPVVPGPYVVHADADGFLPPAPVEVDIGPEGFVGKEQVLVLVRPAKIEGVVVDADGRPVEGAEVLVDSEVEFTVGEGDSRRQMFSVAIGASEGSLGVTTGRVPDIPLFGNDEEESASISVVTDEDGRFEIEALLPGKHKLRAVHGQHAASAVRALELRSGELRGGVELQLREGMPLTGVIRTANGEPIAHAQVDLGDGLILTTDERGVFDAGYRRGAQTLTVRAPGMIPRQVEAQVLEEALDLALELEPARGRFEGRVTDGNGQPIADVEVELRPADGLSPSQITWTDERGLYSFAQLPPGPVELDFSHADYVAASDRATVDELAQLSHEIVLDAGWSAEVLVRSVLAGEPIPGAKVRVGEVEVQANKEGIALLEHLVGEELELEVEAPGWVDRRVVIRDDGTGRVDVLVELPEGGSIEGTIDDDIGEPVVGATIELRAGGTLVATTTSDGRGRWRIDGVPAGDVTLRAEPPTALSAVLAPVRAQSDVIRGEVTTAVRLRFERL